MSNRSAELAKMSRRGLVRTERGQRALEDFFRDQAIRDLRKRSQVVPKETLRKLLPFLRRAYPYGLAAAGLGFAFEIYRSYGGQAEVPASTNGYHDYSPQYGTPTECTPIPTYNGDRYWFNPAGSCVSSQAINYPGLIGTQFDGADIPSSQGDFDVYRHMVAFPFRSQNLLSYQRVASGTGTSKGFIPAGSGTPAKPMIIQDPLEYNRPFPTPAQPRYPQLEPEALPIAQPAPMPFPAPFRALPYRVPNPYAPDVTQPQWGPGPANKPLPWEVPRTVEPSRGEDAGPTIVARPSARDLAWDQPKPDAYRKLRPPKQRTRERKVLVYDAVTRAALKIVNLTTESCDLVNALFKALPDDLRKKLQKDDWRRTKQAMSCVKRAQMVYDNFSQVDMRKAFSNIAENQLEDYAFGKLGKGGAKLARQFGARDVGIGYETGGSLGKTPKGTNVGKKPWDGIYDELFETIFPR